MKIGQGQSNFMWIIAKSAIQCYPQDTNHRVGTINLNCIKKYFNNESYFIDCGIQKHNQKWECALCGLCAYLCLYSNATEYTSACMWLSLLKVCLQPKLAILGPRWRLRGRSRCQACLWLMRSPPSSAEPPELSSDSCQGLEPLARAGWLRSLHHASHFGSRATHTSFSRWLPALQVCHTIWTSPVS